MAINFPDSPTLSDSFTSGDRTWVWNGTTWSNDTAGNIAWGGVSEKPTEFPPEPHNHIKSEITDFDHAHVMADISDLEFLPLTALSTTAPSNPVQGSRWVNTTNFIEYIYHNSFWIEV